VNEEVASIITHETAPEVTLNSEELDEKKETSKKESVEFLRQIQEKAGQISENELEEESLVNEFFSSLIKILRPFTKTLEIAVSSLPGNYRKQTNKAHLHIGGQLVLVQQNNEVEIVNLVDKENRELLVEITGDILAKLKTLIDLHKAETEKRVNFLMSVTQELQKVARVFSQE